MLVSKALLAVPYGTFFTGLPKPLSSLGIASSFAATMPADKASTQYGRMARIAGTAIAAGSVGFGAVRLAALATSSKVRLTAKVPFKNDDVSFNSTAIYDIPPSPVEHKFSFAAAYEASLLTSLAIVEPEPFQLPLASMDQGGFTAGLVDLFNMYTLVYQSPQAATASDAALDKAKSNTGTVMPIGSPTCGVRGSPSLSLRPTVTSSVGNKDKAPGAFIDLKYLLSAFAFFTGLYFGARPFRSSALVDDDQEAIQSLKSYSMSSFIALDLSEEEDLESWIHNDDLFALPYMPYPFWQMMPVRSNFTHKFDIVPFSASMEDIDDLAALPSVLSSSSSVSLQQREAGELITVYEPVTEANPLPHLLVATVIVPAIFFCLQAMPAPSEESSDNEGSVHSVDNDMVGEQGQSYVADVEESNGDASQKVKEEEEEEGESEEEEEETEWQDAVSVIEPEAIKTIQSEPSNEAATNKTVCDTSVCLSDDKHLLSCAPLPDLSPYTEIPLNLEVKQVDIKVTEPEISPRSSPAAPVPALNANASVFIPRRAAASPAVQPIQVYVGSTPYRPPRGARRGF